MCFIYYIYQTKVHTDFDKVIDWDVYTDWALGVVVISTAAATVLLFLSEANIVFAAVVGYSVIVIFWFGFWFTAFAVLLYIRVITATGAGMVNNISNTTRLYLNLPSYVIVIIIKILQNLVHVQRNGIIYIVIDSAFKIKKKSH
jgi:hypothetical protein